MRHRHAISDADWDRIQDLLPGRPGQSGWVSEDNRRFIDAVWYVAKTGIPWRDLPERLGNWNTQWRRFDRWATKGTWKAVFHTLQDPDLEWLIIDSTVIRAHPCAAGARKNPDGTGGQQEQDLGRSRGGFGTKIHGAVSGLGLPVELVLSPGQDADVTHAPAVLADHRPEVVIGDKGFDSDELVRKIRCRGAEAVIPSRKNRKVPRVIDVER